MSSHFLIADFPPIPLYQLLPNSTSADPMSTSDPQQLRDGLPRHCDRLTLLAKELYEEARKQYYDLVFQKEVCSMYSQTIRGLEIKLQDSETRRANTEKRLRALRIKFDRIIRASRIVCYLSRVIFRELTMESIRNSPTANLLRLVVS
jgi:hypothetical protein